MKTIGKSHKIGILLLSLTILITGCYGPQVDDAKYIECTSCHEKNDESFKYCSSCGSALQSSTGEAKNKCGKMDCLAPALNGYSYCFNHKCSLSDCKKIRELSSLYCSTHCCEVVGCSSQVMDGLKYCSNHICVESQCSNRIETGYKYCKDHVSEYYCDNCRNNLKVGDSYYCSDCKCRICNNLRRSDGPHCDTHDCEAGCPNPGLQVNNIIYRYCEAHKCRVPDCGQQRQGDLPYCPQHLWELDYDH